MGVLLPQREKRRSVLHPRPLEEGWAAYCSGFLDVGSRVVLGFGYCFALLRPSLDSYCLHPCDILVGVHELRFRPPWRSGEG